MGATAYTPTPDARPTQSEHPWRATARTLFAAVTAFAGMWAVIVEAIGLNPEWQWVSASLVVTAAITRVLAVPAVEEWLRRFFPWLAAAPPPPVNVPDHEPTTDRLEP